MKNKPDMQKASKEDKLTPKQEAFALKYVECGNASEAYRHAYDVGENTKPESIWTSASLLLSDPKVAQRVFKLQEDARERNSVTVDSLTAELNEARQQAKEDPKGASAHVAAVMGKAKLHGLITDKQQTEHSGAVKVQTLDHFYADTENESDT